MDDRRFGGEEGVDLVGINAGLFSSETPEWATPWEFYKELDREFKFALDVCATAENTKHYRFISPEQDGLKQPWAAMTEGRPCYMNPPYGREIVNWVRKASEEAKKGATVVCLLPARTDTAWFHEYIWDREKHQPREGVEVRLLKGRLKFGDGKNSAPFPSMIVVFKQTKAAEAVREEDSHGKAEG